MTVKELIELNQMITDIEITVREGGHALLDQLNIGISQGIKPPHPTMVPKDERYIGNLSMASKREAHYIDKSINAWDDGKDYWQVKSKRIPKKWLDLEVYAWEVWPAPTVLYAKNRRNDYGNTYKNINFHGQRINIIALPSGESLSVKERRKTDIRAIDDGQMTLAEFTEEVVG